LFATAYLKSDQLNKPSLLLINLCYRYVKRLAPLTQCAARIRVLCTNLDWQYTLRKQDFSGVPDAAALIV
jgi:hypothetical protein